MRGWRDGDLAAHDTLFNLLYSDLLQILINDGKLEEASEHLGVWMPELIPELYERLGGGEEMWAYLASQETEVLNKLGRGKAFSSLMR